MAEDGMYAPLVDVSKEVDEDASPNLTAAAETAQSEGQTEDLSPEAAARREELRIAHSLRDLQKKEKDVSERIEELERTFNRRRRPLLDELARIQHQIRVEIVELDQMRMPNHEVPPGPRWLTWVEGDAFQLVCMVVILANFGVMVVEMKRSDMRQQFWYMDQAFLLWYVIELGLKVVLHRQAFLIGPVNYDRAFRWIDLGIVIGGIVEQWVMPLVTSEHGSWLPFNTQSLRMLRLLRVTRLFRILKGIYLIALMDISWIDGRKFEVFITMVILANGIVMGIELDFDWIGFHWLNLAFLTIFCLEVLVKLKRHRMKFFNGVNYMWNRLDFFIVTCGIVETFALPAYETIFYMVTGEEPRYTPDPALLSLLRIFRLFRVMRLYRVLTSVKALRSLVLGIADAMQGTMWVIILTFLVLYIFAIVFTTLVGRGLVVSREDNKEAVETFGTVELSMYTLFKLMNDDQSVVMFTESVWVKLLFMLSMVILNWVMLATLTSVVTDHMNSATSRTERAEELRCEKDRQRRSEIRLINLFKEVDKDKSGFIDDVEFQSILTEPCLRQELCESSGLCTRDLVELFDYLSHDFVESGHPERRVILYEDFVTKLKCESKPASERTVFRLEEELRASERRMVQRFENLIGMIKEPASITGADLAVQLPGPSPPRWEAKAKHVSQIEEDQGWHSRGASKSSMHMETTCTSAIDDDMRGTESMSPMSMMARFSEAVVGRGSDAR